VVLVAGVGGSYESCAERSKPRIWVEKILDSTGGKYSIHGLGFKNGETVSLTIQNAPLMRPSGWHLGNTLAIDGTFSFQTEGFRCVRVDEEKPRENYSKQRVIFVATGLRSSLAATAADTAGEVFVCR
jgi:hypothetical protein